MHARVNRKRGTRCTRGGQVPPSSPAPFNFRASARYIDLYRDAGDETTLEGVKIRPVSRSLILQLFGTTFTCATALWLSRAVRFRATNSAFGATAAAFFRSACAAAASFDNQFRTARFEYASAR